MIHHPDTPPPSPGPAPAASPAPPPDRPHGLDPRALLKAVAAPTGTPESQPHPLSDPGQLAASFPQLEIGECLGRGGMGIVYRARQRSLDRTVALKLLAPERGHDPAFAARFAREAQALARLNHPNIVTIHDFGQADGFYYLLMEFVDGVNLRQAMQAGRFTPEQALAIVPPVCDALHYAHSQGLVHRDIKPENLLLDKDGRIKIADFGIAKMLDANEPDSGPAESQPAGTPRYMAPEQQDTSRHTDHRADIYSLGVVLYELLTGEVPGSQLEPPSRRVQIDVRLDEIVLRALEAEPERRYQTAIELRTRIEDLGATGRAAVPAALDSATEPKVLRTGRAPTLAPPSQLDLPGSSPWLAAALLVPLVAGLGLGIWLLDSSHSPMAGRARPSSGPGLATVVLLTVAAITPILGAGRTGKSALSSPGTAIGLGALLLATVTLLGQPGFVEVLIPGAAASLFIHWLKNRGERVPGPQEPAAPGSQTAHRLVFAAAIGLTVLFAAPHYSVLGAGNVMVWEVGLPSPWLTDMLQVFPPHGSQQRVRDMTLDRPSFYFGFAALASWMLWLRLLAGRHRAALFEVVTPATVAGDRPRVRWATLASVWTAMASLSVIALLLVCVFMRAILGDFPAPAPLLVMAVFPVSLFVLNRLRLGLRQARAATRSTGPATRPSCMQGCLWLAAILAFGLLILVAVWSMTLTEYFDASTPSATHPAPAPQ
jgi:serine/threonine protein kinase